MATKKKSEAASKRDSRYDRYELFLPIAGRGFGGPDNLPEALTDDGGLIDAPIEPGMRESSHTEEDYAFAHGAEFADVCRAMLDRTRPFVSVVRSGNVHRLAAAAFTIGRELTIDVIPLDEDPDRLYARILVGEKLKPKKSKAG